MKQQILRSVTVRFPEPVHQRLEETAVREHRTLSDQIRHLVAIALDQRRQQQDEEMAA